MNRERDQILVLRPVQNAMLFVNFVVNSPLLVYAVRIAPGAPFSTTNEARVLIGSSGLVTAATMR